MPLSSVHLHDPFCDWLVALVTPRSEEITPAGVTVGVSIVSFELLVGFVAVRTSEAVAVDLTSFMGDIILTPHDGFFARMAMVLLHSLVGDIPWDLICC